MIEDHIQFLPKCNVYMSKGKTHDDCSGHIPPVKDKTSVWHHFEMDRSLKTSKGPFKNRQISTVYLWLDRNWHTASTQETVGMTDTPADSGSHRIPAWIFVFWVEQQMKWNSLELMDFFHAITLNLVFGITCYYIQVYGAKFEYRFLKLACWF